MSQNVRYEEKYRPDAILRPGDKDHRQVNGDHSTSKRKYQSSEVRFQQDTCTNMFCIVFVTLTKQSLHQWANLPVFTVCMGKSN